MAAYPALVSLTRLIDQILQYDQHCFPIPLIKDSEEQHILKSLQEKLSLLLDFLDDHFIHCNNETVISLAGRIRDAAYHVEDLIESHLSNMILTKKDDDLRPGFNNVSSRSQQIDDDDDDDDGKRHGLKSVFGQWFSRLGQTLLPRKQKQWERDSMAGITVNLFKEDLQKLMEEIDSILEEAEKIMGSSCTSDHQPSQTSSKSESDISNRMVGLDDDTTKLKEWLCGEPSRLQTISIVGMGGTGKTTLAKNLFDDLLVAYHFHKRAWVTISQDYCLQETLMVLVKSLVETAKEDLSQKSSDLALEERVYKSLKGRKYLIVLDDMWGTDAWDDLRMIFPDDCNGSRVVLTTRLLDVSLYVDESRAHLHEMQFLNADHSWDLMQEKVFAFEKCPIELEMIGKKIATKCGGLPLAIVLAAGVLNKAPRRLHDWEKFATSVGLTLASDDECFSNIMSLSYNQLPHHLKPCFLYIGGFPEDYEIPVFKLVQLWIAEGFIRPICGSKSLEQVGEGYLEDLIRRNLVLVTKRSSTGKIRFCRIHDLLRDFCINKAQDENLFHGSKHLIRKGTENKRRMFLSRHNSWHLFQLLRNSNMLHFRSIIFSAHYFKTEIPSLVAASKLLRVFEGLEVEMSASSIHQVTGLIHLRYLSFALSPFDKFILPTSISRLRNLHTLIIRGNPSFPISRIHLPCEIWEMMQLRHLIVQKACYLPNPRGHARASVLENLQTLSRIVDFVFDHKSVKMIPNVKKLGLIYTEWYSSLKRSKYRLDNLVHLRSLESLNLRIDSIELNDYPMDLAFPPKLRKLCLYGCTFPWEKMRDIGSLPDLEVLKLRFNAFRGEEWETNEEEFPKLKFLLMDSISLVYWRAESSHFPSLQRLIINKCEYLQEIPSGIGDIPTLQLIEVGRGCKSVADSALRIQKEQEDMGNDSLRVRVVH